MAFSPSRLGCSGLRRIEALDPVEDHQEIYRISFVEEFPWDYRWALRLALFRTFCVPVISTLLDVSGEFRHRPAQRYDATARLMHTLARCGYDSARGTDALRAINRAHGRYRIGNDEMLYVLSTFVFEPIDWLDEFGRRQLSEHERTATLHFYRAVGARMAIRDIPGTLGEFRAFKQDYERSEYRFAEANHRVGTHLLDLLTRRRPAPMRRLLDAGFRALLDDEMRAALGYEPPLPGVQWAITRALRSRRAVLHLCPAPSAGGTRRSL